MISPDRESCHGLVSSDLLSNFPSWSRLLRRLCTARDDTHPTHYIAISISTDVTAWS
jgi:hypothetical protein